MEAQQPPVDPDIALLPHFEMRVFRIVDWADEGRAEHEEIASPAKENKVGKIRYLGEKGV